MVPLAKERHDYPTDSRAGNLEVNVDFAIRDAVPGDAPDFATSQIVAWRAAYAGILDAGYLAGMDVERLTTGWARILGDPDRNVRRLAVTVDGTAVGWSGFGRPRDEVPGGTGELHALNVLPAYWSRGLGPALFQASVEGLRTMGYERAYLWVAAGNCRAIRFYERHGWCPDGLTKQDARFDPPLLERRFSASCSWAINMASREPARHDPKFH
ncbi:GNAT family N-acetyltransferase [Arthrobacter sp. EPSL27]|uniref:GNAT family N-acetyltransferase n=1 Tax=Arthrobacter sp. EPSL27 TaxID=1745378 RepID=UPI0009EADF6D|nr:GNAT family N-acetyltransferase [Arthrobacter sp. EPSL27]